MVIYLVGYTQGHGDYRPLLDGWKPGAPQVEVPFVFTDELAADVAEAALSFAADAVEADREAPTETMAFAEQIFEGTNNPATLPRDSAAGAIQDQFINYLNRGSYARPLSVGDTVARVEQKANGDYIVLDAVHCERIGWTEVDLSEARNPISASEVS